MHPTWAVESKPTMVLATVLEFHDRTYVTAAAMQASQHLEQLPTTKADVVQAGVFLKEQCLQLTASALQ